MSAVVSPELLAEAALWRRHLHRHPETAFEEHQTAEFVASRLAKFGLHVHRGLAGTGVVGTLQRGTSTRSIGIRADMDALRIREQGEMPHASSIAGVMHACGHDGHVAMLLAAAGACARLPDLDGTVHFIFQPAEESEGGGQRMVDQGLFRQFPCDEIYALHNWPALPLGSCVALDGPMMAALALFEITLEGRGAHGAMPHEGTDCIVAASQLVSALQSIVSRNVDPLQTAVISVAQIHAGDTWNVIPDACTMRGTTRWFDNDVGDLLERRTLEVSKAVAAACGCTVRVRYKRRCAATVNNPGAAAFVRSVAAQPDLGLRVVSTQPSMASEDFACMLQAVPGCYFWLGTGQTGREHGLHSSRFDFNDDLLPYGVSLWVALVRRALLGR